MAAGTLLVYEPATRSPARSPPRPRAGALDVATAELIARAAERWPLLTAQARATLARAAARATADPRHELAPLDEAALRRRSSTRRACSGSRRERRPPAAHALAHAPAASAPRCGKRPRRAPAASRARRSDDAADAARVADDYRLLAHDLARARALLPARADARVPRERLRARARHAQHGAWHLGARSAQLFRDEIPAVGRWLRPTSCGRRSCSCWPRAAG